MGLPDDIGYLQDVEIHNDAEDVKALELQGSRGAVEVSITDETMIEFLEAAEEICISIHGDMNEIRELLQDNEDKSDRGV